MMPITAPVIIPKLAPFVPKALIISGVETQQPAKPKNPPISRLLKSRITVRSIFKKQTTDTQNVAIIIGSSR